MSRGGLLAEFDWDAFKARLAGARWMIRLIRSCGWLLLGILAGVAATGVGETSLEAFVGQPGRKVVPIYSSSAEAPVAVIIVGTVRQEYERRGFYRIGLLPRLVVDGFEVEIRDASGLGRAASAFESLTALSKALDRIDILSLDWHVGGTAGTRLTARRARRSGGRAWQLTEGAYREPGRPVCLFSRAALTIEPGGCLRLKAAGGATWGEVALFPAATHAGEGAAPGPLPIVP